MKDFIAIKDISKQKFDDILRLAADIKSNPGEYSSALKGKTLAMIFQKTSTRTRVSFEVGMFQLGGHALFLSSSDIQLKLGETIADTARVLSRYVDCIMARVYSHNDILGLAEYSSVPVINGLSDLLHPCQGMTDYLTISEHKGNLKGLKVVYVGDGNNVTHSLLYGAAKADCDMTVITPKGYEANMEIFEESKNEGTGTFVMTNDLDAVCGADVIYTDTWTSMGQESQKEERLKHFGPYQVNDALMKKAKPDAVFMHCLPAHRGEEVTDEVADSKQSVIFDQAENRLHVQKAIMLELMR